MAAMEYELLLCSVYNCSRGGVKGADANIYRNLEIAQQFLTNSNWNKTQEVKDQNYMLAFAEVRMFVRNALRRGLDKIKYSASEEDLISIEEMQAILNQFNFYHKSELDRVINTSIKIFQRNGLREI
jgi:hypothetical protein